MSYRIVALALLGALGGYWDGAPQQALAEPAARGGDRVVQVAADDPAMEAAKRQGRATLPGFFRRLAAPAADETMFSVKYDLVSGPGVEYIWASVVRREPGRVVATLGNVPEAPGFAIGQQVVVPEDAIIDWQIAKAGRMDGHYTTRVLLDRVSPAEAAEYRAALGW